MSNKKIWGIIIVVLAVLLIWAGTSNKTSDREIIRMGYIGPFTGPVAGTSPVLFKDGVLTEVK